MIYKDRPDDYNDSGDGFSGKVLVWGDNTLIIRFKMQAGAKAPMHNHPFEQSGYIVSGRARYTIGDEVYELGPGDSWLIPAGVDHDGEAIEDTEGVEICSPPRQDYIEMTKKLRADLK